MTFGIIGDCHTTTPFIQQPMQNWQPYHQWLYDQLLGHCANGSNAKPVNSSDRRKSLARYMHTMGVVQASTRLAKAVGLTNQAIQQASLAALLHDNAKLWPLQQLLAYATQHNLFNIYDGDLLADYPPTLHAWVGAHWATLHCTITDNTVLDAMRYHTTGFSVTDLDDPHQQLLAVVYVADKLEWQTRQQTYVETFSNQLALPNWLPLPQATPSWQQRRVQRYSIKQLWQSMASLLHNTNSILQARGLPIHPLSQQAFTSLSQLLSHYKEESPFV
jgi:predicted HD superfamily hydrolase involved in NAD metabolism